MSNVSRRKLITGRAGRRSSDAACEIQRIIPAVDKPTPEFLPPSGDPYLVLFPSHAQCREKFCWVLLRFAEALNVSDPTPPSTLTPNAICKILAAPPGPRLKTQSRRYASIPGTVVHFETMSVYCAIT